MGGDYGKALSTVKCKNKQMVCEGGTLSNTKLQGKDNRSSGKEVSYKKNEKLSLCRSPKQAGGRGGVFTQQLTKGLSDVFQRSIG